MNYEISRTLTGNNDITFLKVPGLKAVETRLELNLGETALNFRSESELLTINHKDDVPPIHWHYSCIIATDSVIQRLEYRNST